MEGLVPGASGRSSRRPARRRRRPHRVVASPCPSPSRRCRMVRAADRPVPAASSSTSTRVRPQPSTSSSDGGDVGAAPAARPGRRAPRRTGRRRSRPGPGRGRRGPRSGSAAARRAGHLLELVQHTVDAPRAPRGSPAAACPRGGRSRRSRRSRRRSSACPRSMCWATRIVLRSRSAPLVTQRSSAVSQLRSHRGRTSRRIARLVWNRSRAQLGDRPRRAPGSARTGASRTGATACRVVSPPRARRLIVSDGGRARHR